MCVEAGGGRQAHTLTFTVSVCDARGATPNVTHCMLLMKLLLH